MSWTLRLTPVMAAICLIGVACSGSSPGAANAPSATAPAHTNSPLARRDVPPDDVDALVRFTGGGAGDNCVGLRPGPTVEVLPSRDGRMQLGWPIDICATGFPTGAVVFELLGPDHLVVSRSVLDNDATEYGVENRFDLAVDGVPGQYEVVVSGGGTDVRKILTVARPDQPIVRAVRRHRGDLRPGEPLLLQFGGYPSATTIRLAVYTGANVDHRFATMLPTLTTDANGLARLVLDTAPDDRGCYLIVPYAAQVHEPFLERDEDGVLLVTEEAGDLTFCLAP